MLTAKGADGWGRGQKFMGQGVHSCRCVYNSPRVRQIINSEPILGCESYNGLSLRGISVSFFFFFFGLEINFLTHLGEISEERALPR